jgi:hypothetical protein
MNYNICIEKRSRKLLQNYLKQSFKIHDTAGKELSLLVKFIF